MPHTHLPSLSLSGVDAAVDPRSLCCSAGGWHLLLPSLPPMHACITGMAHMELETCLLMPRRCLSLISLSSERNVYKKEEGRKKEKEGEEGRRERENSIKTILLSLQLSLLSSTSSKEKEGEEERREGKYSRKIPLSNIIPCIF